MFVVIEAPTGIRYKQQFGGTACRQGSVEGFLVPVHSPKALAELRAVFERNLRGTGVWSNNFVWPQELLERVVNATESVEYWPSNEGLPELLRFDSKRQLDEAWVSVQTSDGAGVLMWCNSD